jgi:hypothetical protein
LVVVMAAAVGIYLATRPAPRPEPRLQEVARAEPARVRDPEPVAVPPSAPPATITRPEPDAVPLVHPPTPPAPKRPPKVSEAPADPPVVRAPFSVRDTLNSIPLPTAASGDGVLSVQAEPFGDVFLNGKAYGDAPKEFRLHAGVHVVRVTHPSLGVREKRLTVVAGKRVPWTANFEK